MAKRVSKVVISEVTELQMEDAMSGYAIADAQLAKMTASMDMEMTKVREKYQDSLKSLESVKADNFEIVQRYCEEQKPMLFVKQRHMVNVHGIAGFRLGTPKLKTLPKYTWDKVLEKLKLVLPDYVRTKSEVDKERLLGDRGEEPVATKLNEVGVYVDQEEHFYIELKKETE